MDSYNVDCVTICSVDHCLAVDNREGNDLILPMARVHPDRYYPFAIAKPWSGARAMASLRRVIGEEATGIKLHPPLQGCFLYDHLI